MRRKLLLMLQDGLEVGKFIKELFIGYGTLASLKGSGYLFEIIIEVVKNSDD